MILKALYDYYQRCEDIAPMNMAYVDYYYAIVIDEKGNFIDLEPLGGDDGQPLLVFRPEERTSAPIAHCMGDNGSYVLGIKELKDPSRVEVEFKKNRKNHECFLNDITTIHDALPDNKYSKAVWAFYQTYDSVVRSNITTNSQWNSLSKVLGKHITFRIKGDLKLAACDEEIIRWKVSQIDNDNSERACLVTGKIAKPVDGTYSTFIIGGKSNARLVAFQEHSGYDSYGFTKCLNASISEEAEFKYTTALLKLLAKNSHNKFSIGNRTYLFWASSNDDAALHAEEGLFDLLGFSDSANEDDPNANIMKVREVFKSIFSGRMKTTLDDKFYILGLAPNSARIAVVYWSETKLRDFAGMILKHFEDMNVGDSKHPYYGLKDMLGAVTLSKKHTDATPNLPDTVVKSIFQGLPYPQTLFGAAIRRIRAEQDVTFYGGPCRIAILKAYLNRINKNQIKLQPMLDKDNTNQGYLCGRLFAVLDKMQEEANGTNGVRERYMNSASATPSAVFATLLNLSVHHAEKLGTGRKINFEKLKQEIMDKLSSDGFPAHLDLQDQGRFFVGYYHQRQNFFTGKGNGDTVEKEEDNKQ